MKLKPRPAATVFWTKRRREVGEAEEIFMVWVMMRTGPSFGEIERGLKAEALTVNALFFPF